MVLRKLWRRRGRNQWHTAKGKRRELWRTEKKKSSPMMMQWKEGGEERLSSLSKTMRQRLGEASSCYDASLRALVEQQAAEFFPPKNSKNPTSLNHHLRACVAAVFVSQLFVCGFFCDLCFCHLLRVAFATFLPPRVRQMVQRSSFAWPHPPARKDEGGKCKTLVWPIIIIDISLAHMMGWQWLKRLTWLSIHRWVDGSNPAPSLSVNVTLGNGIDLSKQPCDAPSGKKNTVLVFDW